jgi:hypothetical protein
MVTPERTRPVEKPEITATASPAYAATSKPFMPSMILPVSRWRVWLMKEKNGR